MNIYQNGLRCNSKINDLEKTRNVVLRKTLANMRMDKEKIQTLLEKTAEVIGDKKLIEFMRGLRSS